MSYLMLMCDVRLHWLCVQTRTPSLAHRNDVDTLRFSFRGKFSHMTPADTATEFVMMEQLISFNSARSCSVEPTLVSSGHGVARHSVSADQPIDHRLLHFQQLAFLCTSKQSGSVATWRSERRDLPCHGFSKRRNDCVHELKIVSRTV